MKNHQKHNNAFKKSKIKPGAKKRENKVIVMFDDKGREDYLTGFHKRKVERRKAAVAEIKKKIKEEQIRVREQRHKEYIKMLKERTEALEEAEDDLEDAVTCTTESVQYDHPNHMVTVTTISDLDLTRAHMLGLTNNEANEGKEEEEQQEGETKEEKTTTASMPKKAGNPILNKKIRSLSTALSTFTSQRKRKGKQEGRGKRGRATDKRPAASDGSNKAGRTSKRHRRRQTGKRRHHDD